MSKIKRPGLNPVTIRGFGPGDVNSKVEVSLCRIETEGKPQDGMNRVGQGQKSVTLVLHDGEGKNMRVQGTVILSEAKFIEAMMLLFPDILVDRNSVQIAEMRQLLFNDDPPGFR
jgi:hypothetical protein